jgi:CBS domain-containing protein
MSEQKTTGSAEIRGLLSSVKVSDLPAFSASREVVVVDSKATALEACHILAQAGISSAPVYDTLDHSFKGMIDFRDICALLSKAYSHKGHSGFQDLLTPEVQLTDLIQHGIVGNAPVTIVTDLSKSNPLKGVHLNNTLLEVVTAFLENYHRVCVFAEDSSFAGVLSQSDIIKFVYDKVRH